jgi:plasmid stability protein
MEVIAMSEPVKRSTIYLDSSLHRALRIKAVHTRRSMSDLVNDAVRMALREDQEDLAAFDERAGEPTISYEELLKDLRVHGKI